MVAFELKASPDKIEELFRKRIKFHNLKNRKKFQNEMKKKVESNYEMKKVFIEILQNRSGKKTP